MKKLFLFQVFMLFFVGSHLNLFSQGTSEVEPNNTLIDNANPIISCTGSYGGAVLWDWQNESGDIDIWKIAPGTHGVLSIGVLLVSDGSQVMCRFYESDTPDELGENIEVSDDIVLSPEKYYFLYTEGQQPLFQNSSNFYTWQLSGDLVFPINVSIIDDYSYPQNGEYDYGLTNEDIQLSNPNPSIGENVTITAQIHNYGLCRATSAHGHYSSNGRSAWAEWDFDSPVSETIDITYRCRDDVSVDWRVELDGTHIASPSVPGCGSGLHWKIVTIHDVPINAGSHTIFLGTYQMDFYPDYNLDWIQLGDIHIEAETYDRMGGNDPNPDLRGLLIYPMATNLLESYNLTVQIWDGDPNMDGILLFEDFAGPSNEVYDYWHCSPANTITVQYIENNGQATLECEWIPEEPGEHDIYIVIDPNEVLGEIDETNNIAHRSVVVDEYAQCDQFVKTYGGNDDEQIFSSVQTSDGGIVMTGYTQTAGMGKDLLIMKTNSYGNLVWSKILEKPEDQVGYCVIETYDQGLVVTGYTRHLGPRENLLLAKFDDDGNFLWSKFLHKDPPFPIESIAYSLIEDASDNNKLIVTGILYRVALNRGEAFLAKFSSSGNYLQITSRYHSENDLIGYSLVKADGGFIVVGRSMGVGGIDEDILLLRFNLDGSFDWAYKITEIGGADPERAYSVIKTSDNGIAFTGIAGNDCFVCKFDAGWTDYWCEKYNTATTVGRSIADIDGNLVITGAYSSGSGSVFLAKFDLDGNNVFATRAYGGSGYDIGYTVFKDNQQNLIVSGYSDSWSGTDSDALSMKFNTDGFTCLMNTSPIPPASNWTIDMQGYITASSIGNLNQDNLNPVPDDFSLTTNTVCTNCPPTAFIDSITPNPQFINEPVYFYGHGEDEDGTIEENNWSISEDNLSIFLSAEASFNTTFDDPGTYNIHFKVKDNDGYWSPSEEMNLVILDTCNCLYAGRCTEDMYLEWINNDSTQITYTKSVFDGEGSNNYNDTIWYLTEVNIALIPFGKITKANKIIGYIPGTCDTICTIDVSTVPFHNTARDLSFDNCDNTFWMNFHNVLGGPSELGQIDLSGELLNSYGNMPNHIAGSTIDADNNHLWLVQSGSPDMFYEYDISNPSVDPLLIQSMEVPWIYGIDFSAAGLDYYEEYDLLVAVNKNTNTIEYFRDLVPDSIGGVKWVDNCLLNSSSPDLYGIALLSEANNIFIAGNTPGGPFPIDKYNIEKCNLIIPQGWSGISSYINPFNKSIENIFSPILNELVILQNDTSMFWLGQNVNSLVDWDTHQGYKIKVTEAVELSIAGTRENNKTLQLSESWNLIPVLSECPVDVVGLFAGTDLVIIKEVAGWKVYWPDLSINTLENLDSGKAYFVLMNAAGSVTYPGCDGKLSMMKSFEKLPDNSPWDHVHQTPTTHIVAIDGKAISSLQSGDIIAAFTPSGLCAGMAGYNGNSTALVINGDDIFTETADGFTDNETIRYKLYRPAGDETFDLEVEYDPALDHSGRFHANSLSVITEVTLTGPNSYRDETLAGPGGRYIHIYPNPSKGIFNIEGISGIVDVTLYNAFGEKVLYRDINLPGLIDLSGQANGIYLIRITTGDGIYFNKLIVD